MRPAHALLPALLLLSLTREARAGDPPGAAMRLDYKRDAGAEKACPDEQELRDAMTAHVHRQLFDPAAADLLVVRLQSRNGWYQGIAELRGPTGTPAWTLSLGPVPRDCSAVLDSLALSIAIKVDPRGGSRAAPTIPPSTHRLFGVDGEVLPMPPMPPPPDPTPGLPPAPQQDALVPPPPAPAPEPEYRARLGASGGLALATGPGWSPAFALDVGVRWRDRPLSLALEGSLVPPAGGDLMSGAHLVHVTTYRVTGAAVACGHFARFLFACGVAAAGALHGTGTAMSLNAQPATPFYAGLGPRFGVELPVHRHVAFRISGDALVTLAQPVFRIEGISVYRASLVSGTAAGGLVFTF